MKTARLLITSVDSTTAAILSVFTLGVFAVLYVLLDEEEEDGGGGERR